LTLEHILQKWTLVLRKGYAFAKESRALTLRHLGLCDGRKQCLQR
jgi:hypothetical protein